MYDVVHQLLTELKEHRHNESDQSILSITRLESDGESLWGLVEAGDYGYGAKGINAKTLKASYDRSVDDAEMVPFYFLINLPTDTSKGILILQRLGIRGVQTPFTNALRAVFRDVYPDYMLDIQAHVPSEVMKYLLDGSLKGITLTSYKVPDEIADKLRLGGNLEKHVRLKISVEGTKDHFLRTPGWVKEAIRGRSGMFETSSLPGKPTEEISLTMLYNGNRRTIDFHNPERIAPYIDITNEIETNSSGHPVFNSIHKYSKSLLVDIASEIGRLE